MTPDEAIMAQVKQEQAQMQSMLFQSTSVSGRSSRRSSIAPSAAATDDEGSQQDQYTQESAGISNMFGLLAGKKRKGTGTGTLPKSSSSDSSPKEKTALPGQAPGGKK